MKVGLFLGAGASVPFDMPTTRKIKEDLTTKYRDIQNQLGLGTPAGVLYSALSSRDFEDIEDVYQALSEWRAFETNYGYAKSYLQGLRTSLRLVLDNRETSFNINEFLERIAQAKQSLEDEIFDAYRWKHDRNEKLNAIHSRIFEFMLRYSNDLRIFTTNYDRAIETFCGKNKGTYQFIDGFVYDAEIGFSIWANGDYEAIAANASLAKKKVFLYKIHGSLDWKRHVIHGVVRTGVESRSGDPNFEQSIVIYPSISPKLDAEEKPYSDILKNLSQYAKTADCFIIVGYSFRDHNINEIIAEFMTRGKTLISISPTTIREFRKHILKENPTKEEIKAWNGHTSHKIRKTNPDSSTNDRDVHLIQREMKPDTVASIIKEIDVIFSSRELQ